MSTVKGAGRGSGVADGVMGLGDGVGVVVGTRRATWAVGRAVLGPSAAGSAAITSKTIKPGRTKWRAGRTEGRPLVLEGAPY